MPTSTGCPSARTSKSSFFNPSTKRPCLSKTETSVCTSSVEMRSTSSDFCCCCCCCPRAIVPSVRRQSRRMLRSEEHTSELQSRQYLVCRLLLEKKISTKTST